jgi:hypothetical protein
MGVSEVAWAWEEESEWKGREGQGDVEIFGPWSLALGLDLDFSAGVVDPSGQPATLVWGLE